MNASGLDEVFDELRQRAGQRGLELHPSFFVELENYSRHRFVDELSSGDAHLVLRSLGEEAMETRRPYRTPEIGGGAIREILYKRCRDPFSDCYSYAKRVLAQEEPAASPSEPREQEERER